MGTRPSTFLISVLCLGIAFLYLPMAALVGYSFNASALASVWGGFSTQWYVALLHNRQVLSAAGLSLEIAVLASTGALVLGTLVVIHEGWPHWSLAEWLRLAALGASGIFRYVVKMVEAGRGALIVALTPAVVAAGDCLLFAAPM